LEKINLSIIIVTWNSEEEIAECLQSIKGQKNIEGDFIFEIIIIDNKSSDHTLNVIRKFKELFNDSITVIENNENLGFTRACNQGIEIATGKNVLLLNPDVEIIGDALYKLYNYLGSNEKIGAVAPQLLNDDMTIQYSCRTFPTYRDMFFEMCLLSTIFSKSKYFARWKMRYFSHNELVEVEQPMAAALMIKKKLLDEIQNMDEQFIMFFNDVDLCKKIYEKGYVIMFYTDARIYHKMGKSVYQDRIRMIELWNRDCLSYFKKYNNNSFLYSFLYLGLIITGFVRISGIKISTFFRNIFNKRRR
jgi:GT2 family glycosyltransferase